MQFAFCPCRGKTDEIFILRQIQEQDQAKNRKLYKAFVQLEKTFDRVPQRVSIVLAMHVGARSRTRVCVCFFFLSTVKISPD